jgi:hypothetical protein
MDWRIFMGLSLTTLWLGMGLAYISGNVGWTAFVQLPAEELGSFLEGAFAPLAFLWLVIGYFLQQQELIQNTQAMRDQAQEIGRTAEQAIIQSEKLAASESRELLGATVNFASEAERFDLFYKTEIRARHTNQFIFVFERLLKHVRSSDTNNMLFDSLIGSAHGLLYLRMKTYQAKAPSKWKDHSKTVQIVEL